MKDKKLILKILVPVVIVMVIVGICLLKIHQKKKK